MADDELKQKVEKVLGDIRPMLQRDGGDVELIDIGDDNIVKVRLSGACRGCPMAKLTLKNGVEARVKQEVPEVVAVESVEES